MSHFYHIALGTLNGTQRAQNEDALIYHYPTNPAILDDYGVFVGVADGVGSRAQSARASKLALAQLVHAYYQSRPQQPANERLRAALSEVNTRLYHQAGGGATTLTVAVLQGAGYTLAHVGDSAAFCVDVRRAQRLTSEHVLLTRGGKHTLTQAIGAKPTLTPEIITGTLQPQERLLLVTDGITHTFDAVQIHHQIQQLSVHKALETLITAANAHSGADNLTAVLIEPLATPPTSSLAEWVAQLAPAVTPATDNLLIWQPTPAAPNPDPDPPVPNVAPAQIQWGWVLMAALMVIGLALMFGIGVLYLTR